MGKPTHHLPQTRSVLRSCLHATSPMQWAVSGLDIARHMSSRALVTVASIDDAHCSGQGLAGGLCDHTDVVPVVWPSDGQG